MSARDEILRANAEFARTFEWGDLTAPPSRRLAIVSCMDARVDPLRLLGLEPGEAHVIRNAGGLVTDDALRSLAISHWELGTQEACVIGHTDCGMTRFTNDTLRRKVAAFGVDPGSLDFLPFPDVDGSVRESLRRIADRRSWPRPTPRTASSTRSTNGALREIA